MSAMDHAFIKAYAKEASGAAQPAATPIRSVPVNSKAATAAEDAYSSGAWYRIDPAPGSEAESVVVARASASPAPQSDFTNVVQQIAAVNAAAARAAANFMAPPQPLVDPEPQRPEVSPQPDTKHPQPQHPSVNEAAANEPVQPVYSYHEFPEIVSLAGSRGQPAPTARSEQSAMQMPAAPTTSRSSHSQPTREKQAEEPEVKSTASAATKNIEVTEPKQPELKKASQPEVTSEPRREETAEETEPLNPAWEVDALVWPKICDRLLDNDPKYYRQLGERLRASSQEGLRVLGVTGATAGVGCTTLSLCLARAAATAGVKTALVDANFDQPAVAKQLQLDLPCGWEDAIRGKSPLAESSVVSLQDEITLLPLRSDAAARGVALREPRARRVLQEAAEHFELVIVDAGAVGQWLRYPVADLPLDAAVLVHDIRCKSKIETEAGLAALEAAGVQATALAENFAADPQV